MPNDAQNDAHSTMPDGPARELSDAALDMLTMRERTRLVTPLVTWDALAMRLHEEGIIRMDADKAEHTSARTLASIPASERIMPRHRSPLMQWTMRTAASVMLLGVGVVIGRTTMQPSMRPVAPQTAAQSGLTNTPIALPTAFTSESEARQVLATAQTEYQRATAYLAAADTMGARIIENPNLYRKRLAAFDEMMVVTQNALREAPYDPLLNQYYISTVGAREATLQQLDRALPVGVQVRHY